MIKHRPFKFQVLLLFFIVSLTPALTVSALWFWFARQNGPGDVYITLGRFVTPIAILGLLPAIFLSLVFAELLMMPIRRMNQAIQEIVKGNLNHHIQSRHDEFAEMAQGLNDITGHLRRSLEQMAAELEQINNERQRLKIVLDTIRDGVVALDKNFGILMFNRAAEQLTGQSLGAVAGQNLRKVLPFELNDQPVLAEWLEHSTQADSSSWKSLRLWRKNQPDLIVNLQAIRVNDLNGIKALITFADLTQAAELENLEVNFVALAAHELRTPITTLRGYLDVLHMETTTELSDKHQKMLEQAIQSGGALYSLTSNLLNISRIEQGKLHYDLTPTDWPEYLAKIETDLTHRLSSQDRRVVVKVPKRLPRVAVDQLAMAEVFYNLFDNAVRYTKTDDAITITSQLSPDHQEIITTISDPGAGIPTESLPHLFTKFYQVGGLRSKNGTGLGLYLCRRIVEAHYGHIWVESKLGHGTTFGFNLPMAKKVAEMTQAKDNRNERELHGWTKTDPDN